MLSTTAFLKAGLFRMGIRGTIKYEFDAYEGPLRVDVSINTTDEYYLFVELAHPSRASADEGCPQRYRVRLVRTRQPFGGVRWWFCCPKTENRSVRLFLPLGGRRFLSRKAYGLAYASQREDAGGRAQLQAQKLYNQLGGDGHWMDEPPPKPKGMRWRTYERKVAKLEHHCQRFDSEGLIAAAKAMNIE